MCLESVQGDTGKSSFCCSQDKDLGLSHVRAMAAGEAKVVEGRNGEEYFRINLAGSSASTGKVEL